MGDYRPSDPHDVVEPLQHAIGQANERMWRLVDEVETLRAEVARREAETAVLRDGIERAVSAYVDAGKFVAGLIFKGLVETLKEATEVRGV